MHMFIFIHLSLSGCLHSSISASVFENPTHESSVINIKSDIDENPSESPCELPFASKGESYCEDERVIVSHNVRDAHKIVSHVMVSHSERDSHVLYTYGYYV
ncbi:hypothetical protein O6H91_17G040900 [Diphasiastrum complanatum]|uniref:Uncharacterized protein n=1 Tax=Diphasiastrum complanatum TaxID=34168 RepID=A0ACC2B5X8_DIPCM|nr:hypothetical protein O6H91_17G040900 [Diphasiastrum complanatum]